MADDQQERTEEATQQRREEFRRRGQVAHTRELAGVLVLLMSGAMLWFLGRFFLEQLFQIFSGTLGRYVVAAAREGDLFSALKFVIEKSIMIVGPFFAVLAVIGLMSTVVQIGFVYNEDAMDFNLERLSPLAGLQRLFSLRSVVEGFKAGVKLSIVMLVAYLVVRGRLAEIPRLGSFEPRQLVSYAGILTIRLLFAVGFVMVAVAVADYFFLRWDLEKQMRMTKQEVKEEFKAREGDPQIKTRMRRIQRERATKRMMSAVPKADVIVTNPTHIACALEYNPAKMAAPRLVAKGTGAIAEKIKQVARDAGVPIIENKPLARTLFKTMKVGQVIPRELFTAVAQVLSYVYRLRKRRLG